MNKFIIVLLFLVSACANLPSSKTVANCVFPSEEVFPGGVINYEFDSNGINIEDSLYSDNLDFIICESNKNIVNIIIPIPLSFEKKEVNFGVPGLFSASFPIKERYYRESRIEIKNKDLVNPPSSFNERISKEYALGIKAKQTVSDRKLRNTKMEMPLEGIISSEFGVRRFINNQPRNRHVGLDIAADEGTPVIAPLKGEVIISDEFFYKGNVVYIDHGNGLVSSYSHLSERKVSTGDNVSKGQVLGYVGSTGRVTGPHLHWEISLLGISLDPEIFVNQ